MFSLPEPIKGSTVLRSDTATTPYPTHQIITTLPSSRKRGDWGLKRPLPLKSTTKDTHALIRVKQIDSIEHITDFASASDHGITLRKFQELNIPLTVPASSKTSGMGFARRSVFEEDSDITDIDPTKIADSADKRWKFSGPWLAGMTTGEFKAYIAKQVRPRQQEFQEFVKKDLAAIKTEQATKKWLDQGLEQSGQKPAPIEAKDVSEEETVEYLRELRRTRWKLFELVSQFLDLAPLAPPESLAQITSPLALSVPPATKGAQSPYAEQGPPISHPSAGLSYLRTASYIDNHPLYGPQKVHPPVPGRVLKPRRQGLQADPTIGVAGFVASTQGHGSFNAKGYVAVALGTFNPDLDGGNRIWVEAKAATVDPLGKVIVNVTEADRVAKLIAEEALGKASVFEADIRPKERRQGATEIRNRFKAKPTKFSSAAAYGTDGWKKNGATPAAAPAAAPEDAPKDSSN